MKKTSYIAITSCLPIIFALNGCDKLMKKEVDCNNDVAIELIKSSIQKDIFSHSQLIAQNSGSPVESSVIKLALDQIRFNLEDIRTSKKDSQSSKKYCEGILDIKLTNDLVSRADFVRDFKGEAVIKEDALQKNINLQANHIKFNLEYTVQPTDDGDKLFVKVLNIQEIQGFVASIVADASQKHIVQNQQSDAVKDLLDKIAEAEEAVSDEAEEQETSNHQRQTSQTEENTEATEETEETVDIDVIESETEAAKEKMNFKRREFNRMWNNAPLEAQESLMEDQREWVAERDKICIAEAKEADPVRQEIVRMNCITRLLGERYYEVKKYFDEY